MSNLQEVPTDELLSFQDFPPVHNSSSFSNSNPQTTIPILIDATSKENVTFNDLQKQETDPLENNREVRSFWTLNFYQKYFDVDTSDVVERLLGSIIPRRTDLHSSKIKLKPDLYGPFWISLTLIFTIAVSGNVANYLHHENDHYSWKYDFHLVSYAATAIILYISLVPLSFWTALKWSSDINDDIEPITGPLELICIYGYSLFIYIPVSILWSIPISWFQWLLVLVAALLSGSVLVNSLMPSIRQSRHKIFLILGVASCHLLLAIGFMLYFFHVPPSPVILVPTGKPIIATNNTVV